MGLDTSELDIMGKLLDMLHIVGMPVDDLRGQLPLNPHVSFNMRGLEEISGLVVHHSAGWPYATAEGIAQWSIEKRNFPGMPYTFYLRVPFTTEPMPYPWAFCNELTEWGHHALGVNLESFGVCLGGNYQYTKPPLWMVNSLTKLIDILLDFFSEEIGTELWVKPHYEVSATACPGRVWEAYQEYKESG